MLFYQNTKKKKNINNKKTITEKNYLKRNFSVL